MPSRHDLKKIAYTPAHLFNMVSGAALLKVASMFCIFSGGVVLARYLGAEEYGHYSWVLAFISLLGIPARLGLPLLLTRDIARYRVDERWEDIKGIVEYSNSFVFGLSTLIVLLVFFVIQNNLLAISERDTTLLYLGLIILPFMSFSYIRCAALKGLHEVIPSEIPELLARPLLMLLFVVFFILLDKEVDAGLAIKMQALAVMLSFLLGLYIFKRRFGFKFSSLSSNWSFSDWTKSTLSLGMFSGLKISDVHLMPFIIGVVGMSSDVGIFRVVIHIASMVVFFLSVIEMILSPCIARLSQQEDVESLKKMFYLSLQAVVVTSIPIFFIIFFFGKDIIVGVFGEGYADAYLAMIIMCIAQLFNAVTGPAAVVLNMTGNERHATNNLFFTIFLKVSLCFALVPHFGFTGAVVAESAGLILNKVMMINKVVKLF